MLKRLFIAATMSVTFAAPAFAHLDPTEHGSFMAGVSHPLFGADHILAMVAVGLWASQIAVNSGNRRPLWIVPAAILASVVALGLLVAMAARLPVVASAAVVAVFALFHGHAHGGELGTAGALQFGIGFMAATALLHAAGIGLGLGIGRLAPWATRLAGGLTALAGLTLAFG